MKLFLCLLFLPLATAFDVGIRGTRCNLDPSKGEVSNPCGALYNAVCDGHHCRCSPDMHEDKELRRCAPGVPEKSSTSRPTQSDPLDDLPFDYFPKKPANAVTTSTTPRGTNVWPIAPEPTSVRTLTTTSHPLHNGATVGEFDEEAAGGGIGGLLFIVLVASCCYFCCCRKKRAQNEGVQSRPTGVMGSLNRLFKRGGGTHDGGVVSMQMMQQQPGQQGQLTTTYVAPGQPGYIPPGQIGYITQVQTSYPPQIPAAGGSAYPIMTQSHAPPTYPPPQPIGFPPPVPEGGGLPPYSAALPPAPPTYPPLHPAPFPPQAEMMQKQPPYNPSAPPST